MKPEQIYNLKNTRMDLLTTADTALTSKDMSAYDAAMLKVTALNAEITAGEALLAENARFGAEEQQNFITHVAPVETATKNTLLTMQDTLRSGKTYEDAWAAAIRGGVSVKNGVGDETLRPLYNALTVGGGTPAGTDGGFLVPIGFDNMLTEATRDYVDLAPRFTVESVTAPTGWRAHETSALRKVLPVVDELATIGKNDQPSFGQIKYAVKKYGDRLPVSSELLADNTVGLMRYLANWFGPKLMLTRNAMLLALLDKLTPTALTAGKELREIKKALNTSLNTAYSRGATLLTNQSGFDLMDGWEDKNGRGLLVPNPADASMQRLCGREVLYGDNDQIPNAKNDVSAPLYIGNFKAFATLFVRQGLEVASTNIGGDSWVTDSCELRAICRMDAQMTDPAAAIKRTLGLAPAA